jgi:hypothetical protein
MQLVMFGSTSVTVLKKKLSMNPGKMSSLATETKIDEPEVIQAALGSPFEIAAKQPNPSQCRCRN